MLTASSECWVSVLAPLSLSLSLQDNERVLATSLQDKDKLRLTHCICRILLPGAFRASKALFRASKALWRGVCTHASSWPLPRPPGQLVPNDALAWLSMQRVTCDDDTGRATCHGMASHHDTWHAKSRATCHDWQDTVSEYPDTARIPRGGLAIYSDTYKTAHSSSQTAGLLECVSSLCISALSQPRKTCLAW